MPFPILGIVLIVRRVENFLSKYFSALFFASRHNSEQFPRDLRPGVSANNCAYSFPGRKLQPPGKKNFIKPKPNKAQKKSEPAEADPDRARSPIREKEGELEPPFPR